MWLKIRRLRGQLRRQEEYLKGLREIVTGLETLMTASKSTPLGNRVEGLVVKILTCEALIKELRAEISETIPAIADELDRLDDPLKTLLKLRYVDGLSWKKISRALRMPRVEVLSLHEKFFDNHSQK